MGFYGNLMGFYSDLIGFYSDLMGYLMTNGILMIYGGFYSHGGTPSSLDVFFFGTLI